jgi:hypothetical protein
MIDDDILSFSQNSNKGIFSGISSLRRICIALVFLMVIAGCATTATQTSSSFEPRSINDINFRDRSRSKYDEEVRVTVAIPTADENKVRFSAYLAFREILPVWVKVENHSDRAYYLLSVGFDPKRDIVPLTIFAAEAPTLLQDKRIDAYFFTVGHPSETSRMALSTQRKARIIPISGPEVDKLLADNPDYAKTRIEMRQLYPDLEGQPDDVNTFGVVATLCTSTRIPEEVVYAVTKLVFENLDELRGRHPALVGLTKKGMLEGLSAPLHAGALNYYRQAGLMR